MLPRLGHIASRIKWNSFTRSSNSYCTPVSNKRPRRVLFYVPGSDEKKVNKALDLELDMVVLDIEDGVAHNRKNEARQLIVETLRNKNFNPKTERSIRMNHVGSGHETDDLKNAIIPSLPYLHSVVIPKVEKVSDLLYVAYHLSPKTRYVELVACIESAKGVVNIKDICETKLPRNVKLTGLVYASEDICANMGMTRTDTRKELLYTRQTVVTYAKAYDLDAIDLVCIQFRDENVLLDECLEGSQMGFTGKQAIHPNQIQAITKAFAPPQAQVDFAKKILDQYEIHSSEGKGAYEVDGKMIDMPMVKWARNIVARAIV